MSMIIEEKCPVCGGDIERGYQDSGKRVSRRTEFYYCVTQGKRIGGHLGPNWRPSD